MKISILVRSIIASAVAFSGSLAIADETKTASLDLTGSGGYSSHPFIRLDRESGSSFARVSARATHGWSGERNSTLLSGYWEGSEYFRGGLKSLVSARAQTKHAQSERLDLFGSATFTADLDGGLTNRLLYLPQPGQPSTGAEPPKVAADPVLYGGRQYAVGADGGIGWRASERSRISASIGLRRSIFPDLDNRDHTAEFLSGAYDREFSKRTTAGLRLNVTRTEFDHSNDNTTIINPALTVNTLLSEYWTLAGSVGVTMSRVRREVGNVDSFNPSLSASICRESGKQHFCATVAHLTQSSGVAALINTTSVGMQWVARVDAKQTIELSGGYDHIRNSAEGLSSFRTDQYHAAARYIRRVNRRCSMGVELSTRGLGAYETQRRNDFTGLLFFRFRIGDVR